MLACVILGFCGIGVFALNNVTFDLWTLLWFGIIGFVMRQFGFPLAPMILGVVLGNIAELNLARALAIDASLTPFFTRPWSVFFLVIALFSAVFPLFQGHRGRYRWTLFYLPFACFAASVPLFMMGGVPRPTIAVLIIVFGAWTLFKRWKSGWQLDSNAAS
jgi:putative tricarboxylic transport membrane protein